MNCDLTCSKDLRHIFLREPVCYCECVNSSEVNHFINSHLGCKKIKIRKDEAGSWQADKTPSKIIRGGGWLIFTFTFQLHLQFRRRQPVFLPLFFKQPGNVKSHVNDLSNSGTYLN